MTSTNLTITERILAGLVYIVGIYPWIGAYLQWAGVELQMDPQTSYQTFQNSWCSFWANAIVQAGVTFGGVYLALVLERRHESRKILNLKKETIENLIDELRNILEEEKALDKRVSKLLAPTFKRHLITTEFLTTNLDRQKQSVFPITFACLNDLREEIVTTNRNAPIDYFEKGRNQTLMNLLEEVHLKLNSDFKNVDLLPSF